MKNKSMKRPLMIIAIGLVLAIAASLLTCVVKEPVITEHDFPFTVTYKLDGETKTLESVYTGRFVSTGKGISPTERYYEGTYSSNSSEYHPATYTIAQKDGLELCIIAIFNVNYQMGDTEGEPESTFVYDPYLAVIDQEGIEYTDEETVGQFDVELISWEYPAPLENSFHFAGFSLLHGASMFAMLAVGILTIFACMILVKRDKTVPYKTLDKVSVVFNFLIVILEIPFSVLLAMGMLLYVGGDELTYQLSLCIPAISAFAIAASVSLRRNGFSKSGMLVQFAGTVLSALTFILE